MIKRELIAKYGGILLGALYGLLLRLIFTFTDKDIFGFSLFSITFIWIVPIVIGIIPIFFTTNAQIEKIKFSILNPALTVLIFFAFALITGIEDILCLFIITLPFMLGAMVGGFIFSTILKNYRKRKGIIYSIILIPFLSTAVENQFETPYNIYRVETSVVVNTSKSNIWKNIIRVNKIKEHEYKKGFFNYAGIPRPFCAELDKDTVGAIRIGYFEGGLTFQETVTKWEQNNNISFDITVIPTSIRTTAFDQHVLKGNYFRFLNASYKLEKLDNDKTVLILSSSYALNTKINSYASFWGRQLLKDFQNRLLQVIKNRSEN